MADTSSQFAGSIPALYDRCMGPIMFQPYADDLSQRVAAQVGDGAVLETACGTGILTRRLRERLARNVRLVATDLNQPMIDHARASVQAASAIEWQRVDCTAMPFEPASFGAVVCQFGMMFPPDKTAAVREARRVLAPGGLFAFSTWDGLDGNPYADAIRQAVASFFPSDPPQFFTVPYGFNDPAFWRDLLATNGFVDVQHEVVELEARSEMAATLATGLIQGSPLSHEILARGGNLDEIVEAATAALVRLGGDAPFVSVSHALVFTARAG
jgi:ubiquinone/menaquinone biosynthesis C-methylase UbiE